MSTQKPRRVQVPPLSCQPGHAPWGSPQKPTDCHLRLRPNSPSSLPTPPPTQRGKCPSCVPISKRVSLLHRHLSPYTAVTFVPVLLRPEAKGRDQLCSSPLPSNPKACPKARPWPAHGRCPIDMFAAWLARWLCWLGGGGHGVWHREHIFWMDHAKVRTADGYFTSGRPK